MDIMMRLKGAGFSAIANAFREREKQLGGGLPLADFVEIVLRGLPRPKSTEEKAASVSALIDLFEDIDINGDGAMEFEEFTSFCVDAGMVATRSQAGTLKHRIQLWDLNDGRARGSLPGHERGVRQLCYSTQHDLLLSASFEFEALAWDLGSRQFVLRLSGHRAPLVGVQLALFQTERAITADCQGVFKVWDITRGNVNSSASSTSQAVQLESIDLGMPSARVEIISFVSMYPHNRDLWVVTSGSCTLQHLCSTRVQQFDEVPLRAFYNYGANKFVVVAGSVCSLWDEFWDEFPILLAADSIGGVYFFAAAPLLHAYTGKLLHAFANEHGTTHRRGRKNSTRFKPESLNENEDDEEEGSDDDNSQDGSSEAEVVLEVAKTAAHKMLEGSKFHRKNALTSALVIKPEVNSSTNPIPPKAPLETSAVVTCMKVVFDEESEQYLLFVGDEKGYVGVWDPAPMMKRLTLAKIPEIKCKFLRRGYQPKATFYRDCTKESTAAEGNNQKDKHRQAVQAHEDALTSLELSQHPNIVVTCALDMRVFVWNWDGECLGKLYDPDEPGSLPWRFRKDDATRTKERELLVRGILQELERSPAEKLEQRRKTIYSEHVGRRSANDLRNVNAMLLEHITNKNPEIKLLEEEVKAKNSLTEVPDVSSTTTKRHKARGKTAGLRALALLPTKDPSTATQRQKLRLHSLNQVSPLRRVEKSGDTATTTPSDQLPLSATEDLKMDKAYLENELSIKCPTSTAIKVTRMNQDADVQQQVLAEYELAQQALATRTTLERKARGMYANLEGIRNRHGAHQLSPDTAELDGGPLEASDFLKRHFPPSALAVRPLTAPDCKQVMDLKMKTMQQRLAKQVKGLQKTFGSYSVQEVMSVIRLFWSMDTDGSGNISLTELQQYQSVFEKLGFRNIATILQTIDSNGDGQVSLRELLEICFHYATKPQIDGMLQLAKVGSVRSFLLGAGGADSISGSGSPNKKGGKTRNYFAGGATGKLLPEHRSELMAIFRVFDHNGDGGVSMQEIMEALRVDDDDVMAAVMYRERDKAGQRIVGADQVVSSGLTREDVEQIYHEFDRDQDATLDFDEFVSVMRNLFVSEVHLA
ncbi:hypothetical protein BBO99_00005405 [Phytophthora kernoviae]|uniref:EF-hand domain-containing protein n=1 Tax=Phytophthora kernoviae TaxID=325452 RepID=A0A421GNN4_9STRA|nr:hypothetical protein BBI17_006244 [Phytophthora kernoviae]RLN79258.1 hypothetical protein BBO99_00005405 [Phytophthora kernoviae]